MRLVAKPRWLTTILTVVAKLRVQLKGVHRVRKTLAGGTLVEYHYAWRGGPRIWDKSMAYGQNSIEYVEAFRHATMARTVTKGTFQDIINEFFGSSEFAKLGDRTKKDNWGNVARKGGIEEEFGKAPIAAFEDKRIRQEILRWRDKFTSGTGDNLMSTMQRIVSFAHERGLLSEHYLLRIKKQVKSNRASIIWTQAEIDLMVKDAPRYVSRILIAAVETGLRPGDLQMLQRSDFQKSNSNDGRIILKTRKSRGKNYATVPVSWRMAALIAKLPFDQGRIITAADGKDFENSDSMGRAITEWRDRLGIRKELRLYDARGTAVTRLLRAGCNLAELASHMGWGYQHAAQMVEKYAALDPDMTDGVREKVERRERLDAEKDS
ncbi:tyrosine-type recombinase/integrase [Loktanella sp. M215]|uniref:tyrosine-type recombinase/integrase n=1 Tax=Loktanella sp. M215 TaxID=2675431 RepID=UPI001F0189C1|nr:tyrosine-type recombinase/integrase [Loktanella sp. M215]MCF7699958.1 tyrosine-type recombinase/integrase [Loktanella sp. M215]